MCYDISFKVQVAELADYFPDLVFDDQIEIDFDKAVHIMGHAYAEHPIIYRNRDDKQLHLKLMEWGCIPFFVKEEKEFVKQRATMLNARGERILEDTKSYWYKIRNRRCLVPMSAFYEHRAVKGFKKKIPYHISLKNEPLLFVAGLYSVVELPDANSGEVIKRFTYTLITRNANEVMRQIHNNGDNRGRMPLMLPPHLALEWLNEDLSEDQYKNILHFEMPASSLDYYPVDTIRSPKARPDGKRKDEMFEWPNLPPLGKDDPGENLFSV